MQSLWFFSHQGLIKVTDTGSASQITEQFRTCYVNYVQLGYNHVTRLTQRDILLPTGFARQNAYIRSDLFYDNQKTQMSKGSGGPRRR